MQAFSSPVDIVVHSRRRRLADPDGISAKWAIDAIVAAGILVDDSAKFVRSVTFSQEKIAAGTSETTTITISERSDC